MHCWVCICGYVLGGHALLGMHWWVCGYVLGGYILAGMWVCIRWTCTGGYVGMYLCGHMRILGGYVLTATAVAPGCLQQLCLRG